MNIALKSLAGTVGAAAAITGLAMAYPPAKVAGSMKAQLFAVVEHVNDANQGDD